MKSLNYRIWSYLYSKGLKTNAQIIEASSLGVLNKNEGDNILGITTT